MQWLKVYMFCYLLGYLLMVFVWPSWMVYKRTGIKPVVFDHSGDVYSYIGKVMKALMALLIVAVLVFSFGGEASSLLFPAAYLQTEGVIWTGFILIHGALLWIKVAQWQMGYSWRVGIDHQHKTALVTKGLFSISRNPVFTGMMVTLTGLFLIMPNALIFSICMSSYIVIQVQIRLEETFLSNQYGLVYEQYKQRVNRFL